ncbi:MAG TPA: RsmG family class I SAM-dependent methyltransferase [Planctomycetota bacterium]|nr:RsmG family class I SAM-dependent methyltransferase [Planctomycetota bacterium]
MKPPQSRGPGAPGGRNNQRGARPNFSARGNRPPHPPRPPGPPGPPRFESRPRPSAPPKPPPEPRVFAPVAPVRLAPEQRTEMAQAITTYAQELGIAPPAQPGWAAFLVRYQEHILGQNSAVNLTTIVEPGDFLVRHHFDSLATVHAAPELLETSGLNIIDIGTGAGFPGIPLWAALPQHHYTLIDGTAKKVRCVEMAFRAAHDECVNEGLWQAGGEAALELLAERAEMLPRTDPKYRRAFDIALARATGPGLEVFENTVSLIKPGGKLILYFADHPARGEAEMIAGLAKREVHCDPGATFAIQHGGHSIQRRHYVITVE